MFHNARIHLTTAYTIGIAVIMAAFSLALYIALQQALAGNLEAPGSASGQLEQAMLASQLIRVRAALLAVNLAGWVISALLSWIVAGRTLRPIEESVERQRRFAAHASHELRTPLTVIKGEIDVTLSRDRTPADYREVLLRVNDEVDHMERAVSSLLDLARSAGRTPGRASRRPVRPALEEMVRPFRARTDEKGIRLLVEPGNPSEASLDWGRIELVMWNLLDNAVRHTPAGGEIRVRAAFQRSAIHFVVFNTGDPIAPDDLPHLFVPFYRGHGKASGLGTGLGLALCEWIAHAQGGSVAVDNTPQGVSFTVRLPLRMKKVSHPFKRALMRRGDAETVQTKYERGQKQ